MGKPRWSDPSSFLPPCGPDSDFCLVATTPENLAPSDSALYFLAPRQDPGCILVPLLGARSDTKRTGKFTGDFLSNSPFARARRRMNHPAFRLPVRPRRGSGCGAPGPGRAGGGWRIPRRGNAAAPAGFAQSNPSKPARRTGERRGRRHLQIASEKSCRANIPAGLGRRGREGWMLRARNAGGAARRAPRSSRPPPEHGQPRLPAGCCGFHPAPLTCCFSDAFFQTPKPSLRAAWEASGGWEAKPKRDGFKLCPCSQPPELDAGTGGISHPELPEGLPTLDVGPQPVLQVPFH